MQLLLKKSRVRQKPHERMHQPNIHAYYILWISGIQPGVREDILRGT
jgi:hypothetical protein